MLIKRNFITLGLTMALLSASAQSPVLDALLDEARQHWPELQQRRAQEQAALAAWNGSKGAGLPQVTFESSYSLAAGGRTIDFPIGDLLNPVYSTLNQLTQTNQFPQLDNVAEQLFPNNFYDAHIRIRYPIYQPEVKAGQAIRAEQAQIAQLNTAVTLLDLERNLRVAYFQWQQALSGEQIIGEARQFLTEALRATNSLIANGTGLPVARSRLEAELAQLDAQRLQARTQAANALALLNYYRGQAPDATIAEEILPDLPYPTLKTTDSSPELAQLRSATTIVGHQQALEDRFYQPRVGVQVDLGSQDFNFRWNPYALAGLSLTVPIYDGKQHRHRQQQLQAEQLALQSQADYVRQSLDLRRTTLWNQYQADVATAQAFDTAIAAARRALQDTERLYREGTVNYLGLVDARTALTQVQQQQNVARYAAWIRYAELLR